MHVKRNCCCEILLLSSDRRKTIGDIHFLLLGRDLFNDVSVLTSSVARLKADACPVLYFLGRKSMIENQNDE